MYNNLKRELTKNNIAAFTDADLSRHSLFRAGGNAALLILATSAQEAERAYLILKASGAPFFVMGNGSNILVSDSGYNGAVLKFSLSKNITEPDSSGLLVCDGGTLAAKACALAMYQRLGGAEFMGSIPGTVAGLTRMNAGCFGYEMKDIVKNVSGYIDGKPFSFDNSQCEFGYRTSIFCKTSDCLILRVTLKLSPAPLEDILQKTQNIRTRRKQTQPTSLPSLGSIFKKTDEQAAAYYIDRAGLKGQSIGGAAVSQKHAGFILNTGGATAFDTAKLITHIKQQVEQKFSKTLHEEIIYLGEFPAPQV